MENPTLKFTEREDVSPICPHCNKPLEEIYLRSKGLGYIQTQNSIAFCPHCRKVLGFGQHAMM